MGHATLVESHIDSGKKLIDELVRDGTDVTAACWVRTSEDDRWWLYIASKAVDDLGITAAYRVIYPTIHRIPDLWIGPLEVKLIGPKNPIAEKMVAVRDSYSARIPIRYRGPRLGELSIEEAFIYPADRN